MATDRSNDQWIEELSQEDTPGKNAAINDLRQYLQRGIFYYLSRERSDLSSLSIADVSQMAEDFAQDAVLRILANVHTFRGDSRFTTWAMKIGTRTAISELRRARYKDFSLDALTANGELMVGLDQSNTINRKIVSPERATEREDVLQIISRGLDEALTERQRRALEAVTIRGIPMDVVADEMNTNRNALYKLLHDARKKLKAYLEAEGVAMSYIINLFE